MLEAGGNAVDAAVATAFALAVVYPEAGNLGGGGFAIYVPHDREAKALAIDFRETAPAGLTAEAFLDENGEVVPERSRWTHLGVGVPGSVAGLHKLHALGGGLLPWEDVVEPAIRLAREGFRVDGWLAKRLRDEKLRARLDQGMSRAIFYPDGEPLRGDDLLVQEELARTLERIALEGPAGFYTGPTADAVAVEILSHGGVMTLKDLAGYEPEEREPLRGWFRGKEIITMPPPSSGGIVLLQVLSILDGFPLDQEREATVADRAGRGTPDPVGLSGRAVHWWIEAMRRAYADRAEHMGDPDFYPVPTDELLDPSWIAQRRISIGERANTGVGPMPSDDGDAEDGNTTHLSVLDGEGNAVSLTTTLNAAFGTGIMVPGAGFFLNNELDDFAVQAGAPNLYGLVGGDANAVEPRKRPLSSMTPTVLRDGGNVVTMVVGARGGPRIISAVIEVILRCEVYGQSVEDAVRAPRVHQQWKPSWTRIEAGWDAVLLQDLRNRGQELRELKGGASVQAIRLDEPGGEPMGFSDPRSGGAAAPVGRAMATPAVPEG